MEWDQLVIRLDNVGNRFINVRYMFMSKLDAKEFRIKVPRPEVMLYIGITLVTALIERWGKGNGRK